MKNFAIIGAGGQCRALLSILEKLPNYNLCKIFDLSSVLIDKFISGIPVEKWDGVQHSETSLGYFLAIGENKLRKKIYQELVKYGRNVPSLIAKDTIINETAKIGPGVVIGSNAFIGFGVTIKENSLVNTGAIIEHETIIGEHCNIGPGSIICGRVEILSLCNIGAGSIVRDKIFINKNTTLGAGAVLVKNVHFEGKTLVGVPAKLSHENED